MSILKTLLVAAGAFYLLADSGTEARSAISWETPKSGSIQSRLKNEPLQTSVENPENFAFKEGTLMPVATFDVTGRVLANKPYWLGRESKVSPMDLVLGWGSLSKQENAIKVDFKQYGRIYKYPENAVGGPNEILLNTANIHIIPSNEEIEAQLEHAKIGKIVRLKGQLVNYTGKMPNAAFWEETNKTWTWRTSGSRSDRGYRSSEILYVEEVEIH